MVASTKCILPKLASKADFHENVALLLKKTNEQGLPRPPVNYRDKTYSRSREYVLLHEEEQHLADSLAFLAQADETPYAVAAVTIEESKSSSSLLVRLAANKTPAKETVQGLGRCLNIVEESARTGAGSDKYKNGLFDQVVKLSKRRLHSRIKSRHHREGKWSRTKFSKPLKSKIQQFLDLLGTQPAQLRTAAQPLYEQLSRLIQALNDVDEGSDLDQEMLLRKVILSSYDVSTYSGSPSLAKWLDTIGFQLNISQHRTVIEIDKITNYLQICNDLIRISHRPKHRDLFKNIHLITCTAPPTSHPNEAAAKHYVHGEVQLILYYERHPVALLPRCIGSSKSACYLCDSFIRKHGKFHISHTHSRLYEQWTIPEEEWMSREHITILDRILRDMTNEILQLMEAPPFRYDGCIAESRAHILVLPSNATISLISVADISESHRTPHSQSIVGSDKTRIINIESSIISPSNVTSVIRPLRTATYSYQDLPIALDILPHTLSYILLVGAVRYIFDTEDVEYGTIVIHVGDYKEQPQMINIRDPALEAGVRVDGGNGGNMLEFIVSDDGKYSICISMTWVYLSSA